MRRWYCYTKWESRLPPNFESRRVITLRLFFLPYPDAGLIKSLRGSQSWRQCRQPYLLGRCPKPRGSRRTFVLLRRPAEAGFYRAILPARPPLAPVGAVVIGLVIGNKMQKRAVSVPKWYREQKTVVLLPFSSKSSKWEQNPPFLLPLLVLRGL